MKRANYWIIGTFLLITLFHYVDTVISGDGRLEYLSLIYLVAFVISMFMTRKSKGCNLFYMVYSFILCVAVIVSRLSALAESSALFAFLYYFAVMLIEPFISLAFFLWGGTNWLSAILGIVLVYLLPFVTLGISFHFYTKNHCE